MTHLFALLDDRSGKIRLAAAWWAVAASVLCAVALWWHVSVLAAHESELHKIINYAPDAVIVCDNHGHVLYANDAVQAITGYSEEDLIRGGVEQVIPVPLRDAHRAGMARAKVKSGRGLEGVNYRSVYPVARKDGSMISCLISVGTVNHFSGPQFFAFIVPVPVQKTPTEPTSGPGERATSEQLTSQQQQQ